MIPWMREKFNEKRAKWLARNKQRTSNETETSSSSTQCTASSVSASGSGSGSSSLSLRSGTSNSLQVHHHVETQTDGNGGGGCILRTPSPARRRRIQLELQLQQQQQQLQKTAAAAARSKERAEQANEKNNAGIRTTSSTIVANPEALPKIGETIIVRVICPSSRVLIFKTDTNKRLNDLKSEVILELSDDPDSIQLFAPDVRHLNPRYRLYRAEYFGGELNESQTLAQLHVRHYETFILSPKRSTLSQTLTHTREVPGPNDALLESATRFVHNNTCSLPIIDINEIFQQSNIQYDVRKVLISLAQASAVIIGAGPYAPRLISMLKQRLVNRRNHQADTLQCLVDMGFSREVADNALRNSNGVYATTLEWLIQNQREELEAQQQNQPIPPHPPSMQRSVSSISPSTIDTDNESIENTAALLQIVRIYSHRDTPPSEECVESLTEMGFDEAAVLVALKKTGNNKASACDWLCENRTASVIELREGLAPDSPILKVILEMPQVQQTLSNPKTFLAFLAILENENAIRVWRGDNDTTSVITHILQKYHEEKHVMGINQFYMNRW